MSATVLYMSMSLDGFIAGPNEGLGDGGHRLHEWFLTGTDAEDKRVGRPAGVNGAVFDEVMSTGAIVAGRPTRLSSTSVPVKNHSWRRCPPSPSPLPGPSFGPAMNPSRDMDM